MVRCLCALDVPVGYHSFNTKCRSAATQSTVRLLGPQILLQACKAKDMSIESLYWLPILTIQAHRMHGFAMELSPLSWAAQDFL